MVKAPPLGVIWSKERLYSRAQKKSREHGTTPGELVMKLLRRWKAQRQSPIIVRFVADSVNPLRQQVSKSVVGVAPRQHPAMDKKEAPASSPGLEVLPLCSRPAHAGVCPDAGRKMLSNRRVAAKYLIRTRQQKEGWRKEKGPSQPKLRPRGGSTQHHLAC